MKKKSRNSLYEALGRNPVHPFPARMAPDIVLKFLRKEKKSIRILDPMMGSGTVVALARRSGHQAVGVDIDPLAVLISRVWSLSVDPAKLVQHAQLVLKRAKKVHLTLNSKTAFPDLADDETKEFISYWFDGGTRRELAALARCIKRVHNKDTRDVLWCAFSRMIITKQAGASLAMDLAHSRPHRVYAKAPLSPFLKFLSSVSFVVSNCVKKTDRAKGPSPIVSRGDARKLPVRASSIGLVLTSPPYLNAIDYMRCSKFTLVWMGHQVKDLGLVRSESVGSEIGAPHTDKNRYARKILKRLRLERKLSRRHQAILVRFIEDMQKSVSEIARVLEPGGRAIYVIGENTLKGTFVENAKIMTAVARRAGLRIRKRTTRKLPANRRYMPPPSKQSALAFGKRMRREVILTFGKPKNWAKRGISS